jgi:hypothetical protein
MWKNLKDKFVGFDQFGAIFLLSIHGTDSSFKSCGGAIATLLINITGFSYLLYLFYAWYSDYMLPNLTTINNYYPNGTFYQLN